jgi:hypothetical protein
MRILLLAAAAAAILAGGAVAMVAVSDDSLALSSATTSPSPGVSPARTTEDVSGPCDEAEHANDPRCTGAEAATTRREDRAGHHHREGHGDRGGADRGTTAGHDATDDRVTGIDDQSGHSGGGDRRGSNNGPGGGNTGHGGGGDDSGGHGGHGRDHPEDD